MSIWVNSGLAIGPQVLVAKAFHDLVIAVEARDHEQLLEELRRLRQRVELPVVQARGHEELARAFRRRLVEHRGLDVDEAVVVEVAAHRARGRVPQPERLLHRLAAQVEVAILEAHLFGQVLLVDHEGRRGGGIEDLELVGEHLDFPASQGGVHRALGAAADDPRHAQHELVAHAVGRREGRGAIRVADHLHQALAIAQVDEDHAAVVAPAVRPAEEGDALAQETGVGEAAVFGAHSCRYGDGGETLEAILFSRAAGSATPMEMMYLSAASTLMSSSMVSERGTTRKNPAVMFGVVGTNTDILSCPRMSATSCCGVPVTSATVQLPACG